MLGNNKLMLLLAYKLHYKYKFVSYTESNRMDMEVCEMPANASELGSLKVHFYCNSVHRSLEYISACLKLILTQRTIIMISVHEVSIT